MSIETQIAELIIALERNTAALGAAPKTRAKKDTTESTQPAATSATPATTAPVTGQPSQSPAASATPVVPAAKPEPAQLLVSATEAVIKLANEYSRDAAVGILSKKRGPVGERAGVTRCSDLNQADWSDVLNEATAAIIKEESAKKAAANASLV